MPRATPLRLRVLGLAAALLALLLVSALLLPRGEAQRPPLRLSSAEEAGLRHATAGRSAVTPAATAEIDRVVDAGLVSARHVDARSTPGALAAAEIRCADFEGQHYCLHLGWTDRSTEHVVRAAAATVAQQAARPRSAARTVGTGDATLLTTLRRAARRQPARQAVADRAELTRAAQAVGKVWLLRHQIQHVPLPAGFLARHPEITLRTRPPKSYATTVASPTPAATRTPSATPSATPTPTATVTAAASPSSAPSSAPSSPLSAAAQVAQAAQAPSGPTVAASTVTPTPTATATTAPTVKPGRAYPGKRHILDPADVAEQTRTYWCGPTAMQMIAWGWTGADAGQDVWAQRLGTTRSGTSIAAMVKVTNAYTGWGDADHAGPYVALDISDFTFHQWWLLLMRHIVDYRAPEILHPVLLKEYYPYLDHDESGHFQVGRGYNKRGRKANRISYFEPFDQQRFDPSEPYIARVQWRNAYKSYRANQAHFQHNIGV